MEKNRGDRHDKDDCLRIRRDNFLEKVSLEERPDASMRDRANARHQAVVNVVRKPRDQELSRKHQQRRKKERCVLVAGERKGPGDQGRGRGEASKGKSVM